MKTNWPAIGLACVLLASSSLLANRISASPDPETPAVKVTAKITPESVRIVARGTAPFTYSTSRPNDRLIVIDLPGAVAAADSHAQMLSRANVGSYRLVPYSSGSKSGVRLEVVLSGPAQPRFERTNNQELDLVFDSTEPVAQPVSARQPAIVHSAPVHISRVSVSAQGQQPSVHIEGTGDFHYHATRVDNPTRLVIDFADATLVTSTNTVAGDSNLIRNVRVGQFQSDVARVVIQLERWSTYTVTTSNSGLTVSFGAPTSSSGVQIASSTANNSSPAAVKAVPTVAADLPLPLWLTQPKFGFATQAPSVPAAPAQQSQAMSVPTQGMTPAATAQTSPKYSGEPIRVNFKDVDLQDFFRLIHEVSGLNVVLDPSVKGSVTLVMEDVPWDQVLDIVLRNNGLDKQLDGNVLRIASRATIKSEADQKVALLAAEAASEPIITVTRRLSYAKAAAQQGGAAAGKQQLGKSMDELLKPFLSPRGSVFGDARTNTLIIRDTQSYIPRIDDLIRQLDRKSQQVEIEARVVLASRSFAQDVGTQIALAGKNGGNVLGGAQQVGTSPFGHGSAGSPTGTIPPLVSAGTTSMPLLTNLGATAATSGLSFEHLAGSFAIDMIITAMESKGVGKLLSAPKILTQNNTEGQTTQGTQIPIQTNINNTISTQYITAALILKVTPQITADGTIFMVVHIENTQIDSGIPAILGQPALSTQSVDDQVLAKDGETVMLGGVMVNSQTTQYNEVPILGSVPIIGNLFKHRNISVQSQELWFFLTPRVTQD